MGLGGLPTKQAEIWIDGQKTSAITDDKGRYTLAAEDFGEKKIGSFMFQAKK